MATTTPKQEPSQCECWKEVNSQLGQRGFKLSSKSLSLRMTSSAIEARLGIPLERLDGKKLRTADPKVAFATHCPWCGRAYPTDH